MRKPLTVDGFSEGQRVRVLEETKGADHDDIEHTMPAGSIGIIDNIRMLAGVQGKTFTVWIPVCGSDERGIVNSFDESDGPITNFIAGVDDAAS